MFVCVIIRAMLVKCSSDGIPNMLHHHPLHVWKMRVITIYEEEREIIVTYVSTSELQRQSNIDRPSQMNEPDHRDFILNI